MNTTHTSQHTESDTNDNGGSTRNYRPALTLYHANGKGTGSAAKFEVIPATGTHDGTVYLTLAAQKSIATGSREQGTRQHATFDWTNRVVVKLNFSDLCHMLPVFMGVADHAGDEKGLYHDSRQASSIIRLARQTEQFPGVLLDISRRMKADSENQTRIRILFTHAEAYGIGVALEQSMGLLAFGIPREFRASATELAVDPDDSADEA